jgi:hypothetical protein
MSSTVSVGLPIRKVPNDGMPTFLQSRIAFAFCSTVARFFRTSRILCEPLSSPNWI